MDDKVMVFIPMYNCEKQIRRVLEKFDDNIQKLFCEVVVIDNISKDNGVESAKKALSRLAHVKTTLLQNNDNYSLGGSIKVAFNYAIENKYDYVITLHGDDQGDIRDIVSHIESGEYKESDVVIGSRFHKKSTLIGYSNFRTLGNKLFNILSSIITGRNINDMIAGLNVFKVNFLKDKFYLQFPNNLTFDAHLLLYAIKNNKELRFVPITWREEDQISNARVFKQGMIILKLLFKYLFTKKALFNVVDNEYSKISYASQIIYQNDIN